ncbi:putative mitochondrial RNA binding complex 1 subunit [Trypanosoma cruzi]|uniref:Putative mitochondrial RNA binding complex 1 subunit n=1 Tax=Trypanosoma cruzi TaxID=5693 RepID=A0A2V2WJD4_TRYCR|nr:putative mitochondrial RNA binding complex 1 subunit [Trypanosoma cruzi]
MVLRPPRELLLTKEDLLKFVELVQETPLKRVKESPVVWRFIEEKARRLRMSELLKPSSSRLSLRRRRRWRCAVIAIVFPTPHNRLYAHKRGGTHENTHKSEKKGGGKRTGNDLSTAITTNIFIYRRIKKGMRGSLQTSVCASFISYCSCRWSGVGWSGARDCILAQGFLKERMGERVVKKQKNK